MQSWKATSNPTEKSCSGEPEQPDVTWSVQCPWETQVVDKKRGLAGSTDLCRGALWPL